MIICLGIQDLFLMILTGARSCAIGKMSDYGLQIFNVDGELTISSEAKLLHYLGKPEFMYTVQASGNAEDTKSNARKSGYSKYRFYNQNQFFVAVDLVIQKSVGVVSIDLVSPGVWDITVYCGSSGDGYGFDNVQHYVDIWAFGFVGLISENWSLSLYDREGKLTADFSRMHPLWPRAVVNGYKTPIQISLDWYAPSFLVCQLNF
ncbi:Uncharacterised protein [Janthinobacterium lividum]|nr:Uncharacterised protein [Janthinobacterium lividum]